MAPPTANCLAVLLGALAVSVGALTDDELTLFNDPAYATLTTGQTRYTLTWQKLPDDRECDNPGSAGNACVLYTGSKMIRIPGSVSTSCKYTLPNGPVGYAKNGAAIFRVFAGPTGAADYSNSGDTYSNNMFNIYNGHCNQAGVYHYHMVPFWNDIVYGETSDFLGVALDGLPIYNITLTAPDSWTDWTADYECNGYFHNTDPSLYRYVLTTSSTVDTDSFGPSIKCFRSSIMGQTCSKRRNIDAQTAKNRIANLAQMLRKWLKQ